MNKARAAGRTGDCHEEKRPSKTEAGGDDGPFAPELVGHERGRHDSHKRDHRHQRVQQPCHMPMSHAHMGPTKLIVMH